MEHANGAKSVIAKAVSGGSDTPSDYWYGVAQEVLDALAEEGYVIQSSEQTEAARLAALEALAQGYTEVQVADTLGVDRMTVRKWNGKR